MQRHEGQLTDIASGFEGYRVLIVEDEILVAMLIEDMLRDLGCQIVATTARQSEALSVIAGEALDAAILDVDLAGEPSFPIAEALAAKAIPYVFSTGYAAADLPADFRSAPVLRKPFASADLAAVLTSARRNQVA